MTNFKKYSPLLAIALLIVFILITISQPKAPEKYTKAYLGVFDTVTQFIGYADSQEEFLEQAETLKKELETYHMLYDIYTYSYGTDINTLRTINENAGIEPVKVDQKIIDLLKFSIDLYHKTDGEINIAMGSVLKIWHVYRNDGINDPEYATLPPMEKLEEAAKHTDIHNIIIDEEASTVYLADPKMSIDVGSIGKGFAVQRVSEYARELGYNHMVIDVGGNVVSVGPRGDNTDWKFAIQNPDLEDKNPQLEVVSFSDKTLVTSGDYQRYYVVDGVEYCHIIDPDTLMPANYSQSVSILTDHSGLADALSTAVFNMPYEEGLALINSIENTEALWVLEDGSIRYSENFEEYIVE